MSVKLFIYQDDTLYSENGITADNTLITADNTFITADQTFELTPFTSRVAKQIDLFDDEIINVTSSIQNINDISKVFTDYSQSFTIPASKNNNETFRYWNENEVDNGFNQLIRYDGFIEIDDEIFRVGKWQLESASVKQNKIENYKITFYGVLLSLTDRFKEDKLKDLETLNDYTIEYSGANVQGAIQTTNDIDVAFPLISSERVWQYGGGGAEDISISSSRMSYDELFPAVKVKRIFDAIETKYNISFSGNFLTQSRFTEAYLWLKNKEVFSRMSEFSRLDFLIENPSTNEYVSFDTFENIYSISYDVNVLRKRMNIFGNLSVNCNWQVSVFKDNQFFRNFNGSGTYIQLGLPTNNGNYYLTIQTSLPCSFDGYVTATHQNYLNDGSGNYDLTTFETTCTFTAFTSGFLDLTQYTPDIKVSDFFSAILKMFNLTAFSYDENNYTLEQLENWYYQGDIKDFTQYTITDLEFERIKAFKKVNFEYEKSESFLNVNFNDTNQRQYGNLSYAFSTDGGDYTIKLPFENIMFNKFTGIDLQVAYALKKDFKTYVPKPIILYKLDNVNSGGFKFYNGTTTITINDYNVFGQDVYYQSEINSLNWGEEFSSFFIETIQNSLFQNYYFDYLNNLYSLKSRMVKVSMRLPYSELLGLKLNDRIVIRDKRYIINQFTTNLKTFEVQLELIQDFRSIYFDNSFATTTDSTAKTLRFDTTSNNPLTWTILQDDTAKIIAINNFDTYVEVEIKNNLTGVDQTYSIISNRNDIIVITQNG